MHECGGLSCQEGGTRRDREPSVTDGLRAELEVRQEPQGQADRRAQGGGGSKSQESKTLTLTKVISLGALEVGVFSPQIPSADLTLLILVNLTS